MIIVTGAAGFIGSTLIQKLNLENFNHIIAVDDLELFKERDYLQNCRVTVLMDKTELVTWLESNANHVESIFHLGAISDTTLDDTNQFTKWNLEYSKMLWQVCVNNQMPFIYASSAATYGDGSNGFYDDHETIESLNPLNQYAQSKHQFDVWALKQKDHPFFWVGLKFFNVYGENETHKKKMASMITQMIHQVDTEGAVSLFRSNELNIRDGEQSRDIIYIDDVVQVMYWMMHHRKNSGIYNVGSGQAITFKSIANEIFNQLGMTQQINWIDFPEHLDGKYQNYTKADIGKLRSIGYTNEFTSMKAGISNVIDSLGRT